MGKRGAPEAEAVFLRRALAEPLPAERAALLLDLGMAEASVGHADWPEHLQSAVDTASNAAAAAEAALVLAHALSSAHRFGKAVEVLDRAAGALDARDSELALALEAAVVAERATCSRHLRPPSWCDPAQPRCEPAGRTTGAASSRRLRLRPDE